MTEDGATADAQATARSSGGSAPRRVLAGLFWLLACLAILVSGVTLWAHQTLLTDEGWGSVVARVAADKEVIDAASTRLVRRLSDALGVQDIAARIIPGEGTLLAGVITGALEDRVAQRVAEFASTPAFQDAFVRANEAGHAAAMRVIRDPDTEAVTSAQGAITLNVFPLIEAVLRELQSMGVIDADREIPDLSSWEADPDRVAALESLLGRDLPDDIGTITLVESDRLATVQSAVRTFDVITVVLILVALACVLLALWLSARRLRMGLWLAVGAIVALLVGRGFTRLVLENVTAALRDGSEGIAVRSVVESAVDSLMWFSFLLIAVALVVAGLIVLVERRGDWAGLLESPATRREWLRARAWVIGLVGVGIVAFVLMWDVVGPDSTLLIAAIVGVILVGVSLLAREDPTTA